jgi:hypothetical protein
MLNMLSDCVLQDHHGGAGITFAGLKAVVSSISNPLSSMPM